MSSAMRGLTVFISDIRDSESKEEEASRVDKELHNIRTHFMQGNMESYDKKKYVCKLLYIYMLGYDFDFGHMEAVNLISGTKYSEKQIGYLACAVLLNENSELVRLIINTIRNDLIGKNGELPRNEVHCCLALAAVANIGGKEIAEALAPCVQKLLLSQTTTVMVKKKAALCLLRLYRSWPEVLPPGEFTDKILNLLEHQNIGVLTAVTSLLLSLVAANPDEYKDATRKVVWLLNQIVMKEESVPHDYIYWSVKCPWLQIKLLRVLQYYPPPEDRNQLTRLSQILQTILQAPDVMVKQGPKDSAGKDLPLPTNSNNAMNAVLFEALDVIIKMDVEPELIIQAAAYLGRFIKSRETNVRYLGLEKMAHLAVANVDALDQIKQHQDTIIISLKDADISIRRRALDLLYSMCDKTNSELIVSEMLGYLNESDFAIRDELVLKIAILAEKFATSLQWYVDKILALVRAGGDHVGDDVWYRLVQIVTNNPSLQEYAGRACLAAIRSPSCHEVAVKISAYILGEFGHLLVESPTNPVGFAEQFNLLHARFVTVGNATKAILLSSYIKLLNLYPDLRVPVLRVFHENEQHMDAEVQQRACEYLILAQGSPDIMTTVWDVIPPFPERESAVIMNAIKRATEGNTDAGPARTTTDGDVQALDVNNLEDDDVKVSAKSVEAGGQSARRAPVAVGGHAATSAPPPSSATTTTGQTSGGSLLGSLGATAPAPAPAHAPGPVQTVDLLSTLTGGGVGGGARPAPTAAPSGGSLLGPSHNLLDDLMGGKLAGASSSTAIIDDAATQAHYAKLLVSPSGVLWQDDSMQIGLQSQFSNQFARFAIYHGNKAQVPIVPVSVEVVDGGPAGLKMTFEPIAEVKANAQTIQLVNVECQDMYTGAPVIAITYGTRHLRLRFPLPPRRFIVPYPLVQADFVKLWNQLAASTEAQVLVAARDAVSVANSNAVSVALNMSVLEGVDPSPTNTVATGMWCSTAGQKPVILRVETNAQAKMYRVTVRSSWTGIRDEVLEFAVSSLGTIVQ